MSENLFFLFLFLAFMVYANKSKKYFLDFIDFQRKYCRTAFTLALCDNAH